MKLISSSIRNQILFWAGLCLLISYIGGISFSIITLQQQAGMAHSAAITAGEEKAAATARDIAGVYNNQLNSALDVSRELALSLAPVSQVALGRVDPAITPSRESVTTMLKSILEAHTNFIGDYVDWEPDAFDANDRNSIGLSNSDQGGRFTPWWARSGSEISLQNNDFTYASEVSSNYYQIPMQTKQETVLEPYLDSIDGKPTLMTSLIVPIMSKDKFLGISGVDIAISDLQIRVDTLAGGLYGGAAQVEIITGKGVVVAISGQPDSAGKTLQEVDPKNWQKISANLQRGKAIIEENDTVELFAPIQPGATNTPWTVMLSVPKKTLSALADAAYAQALQSLWRTIGMGLAFLVFAMLLLWRFSGAIASPIRQADAILVQIAGGDISGDIPPVLMRRADETGSLARSVQGMTENLRAIFRELGHSVEVLGDSSTRLHVISEQTHQGASQSAQQANNVAAAAEEMSANTASVSRSVEEVTTNLTSIAASSEEMAVTIRDIASNSEKARAITTDAVQQANRLSQLVKKMSSAAQEIGNVTESITKISAQTKLLSLNATIEAARAGKAGSGFAVVANEIRDLAQQTTQATGEIKDSIASVQDTTNSTIGEIEAIVRVIKDVSQIVSATVEHIQVHAAATQYIVTNIASASDGVTDASHRVSQTAVVAEDISWDIAGMSITAHEIVSASDNVQTRAMQLSQMADKLRELIGKYKL